MSKIDDICKVILANAALNKTLSNPKIGAHVIGDLLRTYGHLLVSRKKPKDEELISYRAFTSSERQERDHSIPINTLVNEILNLDVSWLENTTGCIVALRVMLQDHIRTVTLTKSEHDMLASATYGLKSSMPTGWYYDDNWQARYQAAGIQVLRKLPDGKVEVY